MRDAASKSLASALRITSFPFLKRGTRVFALGFYRLFDAERIYAVGEATLPLNSLIALRGEIAHLPTWPWPPGTLTGFISDLLIPLVIFLLQGFLARWVGL